MLFDSFFVVTLIVGLCQLSVSVTEGSGAEELDWSAYVEYEEFRNWNKSNEIVFNLPLHQYWDIEKSDYEIGAIPSELLNLEKFQEFVSHMDRKTFVDGVVNVEKNVPVVDTDSLLMHMVGSIQDLYRRKLEHSVVVSRLQREKMDFAKKIVRVAEETGQEWRTASEIRAHTEIIQARVKQYESFLEKERGKSSWRSENRKFRNERRKFLSTQHHENMTRLVTWDLEVQQQRQTEKCVRTHELAIQGLHLEKNLELRDMQGEFDSSKQMILESSNSSVENVVFRVQEETRMERENEKLFLNLTIARAKSAESQINTIVETTFQEIIAHASMALQSPDVVLAWSGAICGILMLATVLLEVGSMIKFYLRKRWSRKSGVRLEGLDGNGPRKAKREDSLESNAGKYSPAGMVENVSGSTMPDMIRDSLSGVVLQSHCFASLQQYLSFFLTVKNNPTLSTDAVLPNALFTGPSGVGKSLVASTIGNIITRSASMERKSASCSFNVITLCGADLLALGPAAAGSHLREIFLNSCGSKSSFHKTLVIIDEADVMIGERGKPVTTISRNDFKASPRKVHSESQDTEQVTPSGSSLPRGDSACFYQILCACRENHPNLAVLLTTTRPLSAIDPAVLDRMDFTVKFDRPTAVLNAHYLLQCIHELLFEYMGVPGSVDNSLTQRILLRLLDYDANAYRALLQSDPSSAPARNVDVVMSTPVVGAKTPAGKGRGRGSVKSKSSVTKSVHMKTLASECDADWYGWDAYKQGLLEIYWELNPSGKATGFDVCANAILLVEAMRSDPGGMWSYREVLKFVRNIQCEVLGTESCELTDCNWQRLLDVTLQNRSQSHSSQD